MTSAHQPYDPAASARCERCGDVIGVYEPMVLVCPGGGWSLRTSLVVTPDAAARGLAFHADCYTPTLRLASTQPVRSTATGGVVREAGER